MALTRTTCSGGLGASDTEVLLTSIAGLAVGHQITIDQEKMRVLAVGSSAAVPVGVIRGIGGSLVVAHPSGAGATFGPPSDFTAAGRSYAKREIISISSNQSLGAGTPGLDRLVLLNGAVAITLTVPVPSIEQDGDLLIIAAAAKAAHVVTVTGGLGAGGGAVDGLTFAATGQNSVVLVAANGVWVPFGSVYSGTMTTVTVTAA